MFRTARRLTFAAWAAERRPRPPGGFNGDVRRGRSASSASSAGS